MMNAILCLMEEQRKLAKNTEEYKKLDNTFQEACTKTKEKLFNSKCE